MILKEYKNIKFLPQCEIKNIYHISWPFGSLEEITKVRYIKRKKNPSLQKKRYVKLIGRFRQIFVAFLENLNCNNNGFSANVHKSRNWNSKYYWCLKNKYVDWAKQYSMQNLNIKSKSDFFFKFKKY